MNKKPQFIITDPYTEKVDRLEIIDPETRPSWKRSGAGTAVFTIEKHQDAAFLSFKIRESAEQGTTKETYFTLQAESAKAFRAWLNARP